MDEMQRIKGKVRIGGIVSILMILCFIAIVGFGFYAWDFWPHKIIVLMVLVVGLEAGFCLGYYIYFKRRLDLELKALVDHN